MLTGSYKFGALFLIVALGLALRLRGLDRVGFNEDEVHKVEAARAYLGGNFLVNLEHPMLMKSLITASLAGLLFPDHFYGLTQTAFLDARSVQDILERLPEGVSEPMCHPGRLDAHLVKTGTRLQAQREVELAALTGPEGKRVLAAKNIQLVNHSAYVTSTAVREAAA